MIFNNNIHKTYFMYVNLFYACACSSYLDVFNYKEEIMIICINIFYF